jgi:hypothetical protein
MARSLLWTTTQICISNELSEFFPICRSYLRSFVVLVEQRFDFNSLVTEEENNALHFIDLQ